MSVPYKFTVGQYGCSVCGGLPGGMHEPDCGATEELRQAIAEEREACAQFSDEHVARCNRYCAVGNPDYSCQFNIAAAIRARK